MASQDFMHHWKIFRDHALAMVLAASHQESPPADEQQIQSLLDRLTQLLFGLDESLKSKATGALDLIIVLVTSLPSPPSESIVLSALKGIKSCVIRNSSGRRQCRSAGIFEWLKDNSVLLSSSSYAQNPAIVEETMTAIAAMCMSNDLNALQGAMQFRIHVNEAAITFSKEKHASLHQKLTYLTALFDVMEREQEALLTEEDLWKNVTTAERTLKAAGLVVDKQATSREYADADDDVDLYSQAIDLVEPYLAKTKLLDPLQWQLHFIRGTVRIKELSDFEYGLEDAEYCAEHPPISKEGSLPSMADVHALRATALAYLGKMDDAKEALAKAIMMEPKHAALEDWKEQLEVWESP